MPNSLGLYSERTGRVRHVDARAGLPRECETALPSGLALLFEKAGRARQLDARTGLHCFILFVQDKGHVALHADETFGSGMPGIVQTVPVSNKVKTQWESRPVNTRCEHEV